MNKIISIAVLIVGLLSACGNPVQVQGILISRPSGSTVWIWNQVNTEILWESGPSSSVLIELWKGGSKADDFSDWTDDDGSYTRSAAIPETWGEGSNYRIKMIDDLGNVGWSAAFMIHPNEILPGIIAGWTFVDGSMEDVSGNGNTATNYSAIPSSDRHGNSNCAYGFDGNSSRRIVSMNLNSYSVLTLSLWVNLAGTNSGAFFSADNTGWDRGIHYGTDNQIYLHTGTGNAATGVTIPSNEWVHLVVVYGSSSMRLYVNSELKWTRSSPASGWGESDWWIGRAPYGYPADAVIDDVFVYDRELTQEEIESLCY